MGKTLEMRGNIYFLEPQAVFSFLFGDDQFMRLYHKEANEDPDAEVTCWTAAGERTVCFSAPLNAPALVRKFVGSDVLRVTEIQQYERVGNCFTVKSNPTSDAAAADVFSTKGRIVLSPTEDGKGCAILINVVLEFKTAVWGLQGTIESFMETKAKKSFERWIEIAQKYCEEQRGLARKALSSFNSNEVDSTLDNDEDIFFEVENGQEQEDEHAVESTSFDQELNNTGPVALESEGHFGTAADNRSELDMWFVKSVMRELNALRVSSDATRSHLEKLNAKLQRMEEDVGSLTSQMQLQKRSEIISPQVAWTVAGLGVGTCLLFVVGRAYLKAGSSQH
ncbi:hypothetical protein CY35_13G101800 [Sphagnum magellanicum]|nr:hypothetical protein CY35_13G101800 [Sphagnum magellanicum]